MKLLVTGAAGFIGAALIPELLSRGHRAIALVRSAAPEHWPRLADLQVVRGDLREARFADLKEQGIEVIVHLAGATRGPAARRFADSVTGTANLLSAARAAGIHRLIALSSIAVLDYRSLPPLAVIDENVATADGAGVGDYVAAKIRQERLLGDFGAEAGNSCAILRPGLVYDRERLTPAHAGVVRTRLALLARHGGEVPTIELHGLACAIANAAERQLAGCQVIHLVDDALPSQSQYIAGLRRRGLLPPTTVVLPWQLLRNMFRVAATVLAASGLRGTLPELLLPGSFAARLKPFRFSNAKAQRLLGWTPGRQFT